MKHTCQRCKAEVDFTLSKAGKALSVTAKPVRAVLPGGEVVKVHVLHGQVCAKARKPRKRRAAKPATAEALDNLTAEAGKVEERRRSRRRGLPTTAVDPATATV